MHTFLRDARFGLRLLSKSPGFTVVAVLVLALGISANTAIFSVIHATYLEPLPLRNADRLVMVWSRVEGNRETVAPADYVDWQKQATVFEDINAWGARPVNLATDDRPEELLASLATPQFLAMFGYGHPLALGRTFLDDEGTPGKDQAAVLTHRLWKERFGGDPNIVGRAIRIDGKPHTVVGVLGPGPADENMVRVWLPLALTPAHMDRRQRWLLVMAVLKPGVTIEQANANLSSVAANLAKTYPETNTGRGVSVEPFRNNFVADTTKTALWLLVGAVAFVLLIACANIANLLLARGTTRQRELAIRTALGATRGDVLRQLVNESVILALAGGAAGVALAYGLVKVIVALLPPFTLPAEVDIRLKHNGESMLHANTRLALAIAVPVAIIAIACASGLPKRTEQRPRDSGNRLAIVQDENQGTISVFRAGNAEPVVTQHARADVRPYLHPIVAPDGRGVLTEDSPAHHKHQTGLYWGFTRVNGRDYFHNLRGDYWRRVSARVTLSQGDEVRWQTVYDLLDQAGIPILTETQRWSMRERDGRFVLDLEWRGEARTDVTIGKYDYGGLFLRMPWREGIAGEVVNAARQRNARAEGQRAMWIDVGMQVEGRDDPVHVAIFDHPDNIGYPQAWRVDAQLGVGAARSRTADWSIKKGETAVIRHQLVVYTGTLDDVELIAAWAKYTGNRGLAPTSALWSLAQKEGREETFLTPEQAVSQMTTLPGYAVSAWSAEPMMGQPIAFCWDDRGRLWVAENRDYESREQGFSNDGTSRIVILEDTNRDGVADSRKVFMDEIVFPTAIAVGFDGVFVGAPPNLLFVPDRNGDDRADMAGIEVRLTGWGIQDRHETLNSLHWGPDGWLYGLQGYATTSKVRKPSGSGRIYKHKEPFPKDLLSGEGVDINGGVWRYHPTKDLFEVVAHGFSNPWGIDYDAKGQLLISACVIPHLWHVIPGGIYQRQGGRHYNPYVYSDIQTIADHRHRSAHGGARVYQSDAFPDSEQGRIFMANIHEHAVLSDVLVRKGSGFTARHGDDFVMANNAQWVGFSLEVGPDGALYVLDWHDSDICGNGVLHKDTGRIFRITPTSSQAEAWEGRYGNLASLTDMQLVELQTSRSDWHARRARVILQSRAAKAPLNAAVHQRLREMFRSPKSPDSRLRVMWTLHVIGGWTPDALVQVLSDHDEHVRAWAIQLLCEDRAPSKIAIAKFAQMAREDPSPVVRLYLASALQRLDHGARWSIASGLMAHAEDSEDHNLPKMLWLGIEPLVAENPVLALEQAAATRIPFIARSIARRTADADALEPLVTAIGRATTPQVSLLEGMRDGLEGRFDATPPPNWGPLHDRLRRLQGPVARLVLEVAQQFGDAETTTRNLKTLRDTRAPLAERRRVLQILAVQRRQPLVAALPALIDDQRLRVEAIRAVAAFDDQALGKLLIARYSAFTTAERSEVVQTLASRPRYGRLLTEALASGVIPKGDVPIHVARQVRRVVGNRFGEVWGSVEQNAAEEKAYTRYRRLLDDVAIAQANVQHGRSVYQRTCQPCHKMYGEGGTLGPDLTGSNRANLDYLLFNVLNPNGDVPDAYRMVVVTTRDGRTFTGNVVAETERQITLRVVGRDDVVINKSIIQSRESTEVSMMPPGLFDTLTDREVIDLVAYLRTVEQVKVR